MSAGAGTGTRGLQRQTGRSHRDALARHHLVVHERQSIRHAGAAPDFHDGAPDAGRRFDVRASLSTKRVRRWMPGKPASAFVQGLEIRITVGEQRFAQLSLDRPGRVMDRIFACYVPISGFVQIVLLSAIAGAILRCGEPCSGNHPLAR